MLDCNDNPCRDTCCNNNCNDNCCCNDNSSDSNWLMILILLILVYCLFCNNKGGLFGGLF